MNRAEFHAAAEKLAAMIPCEVESIHCDVGYVHRFRRSMGRLRHGEDHDWEWTVSIHTRNGEMVQGYAETGELAIDICRGAIAKTFGDLMSKSITHGEQLAAAEMSSAESE